MHKAIIIILLFAILTLYLVSLYKSYKDNKCEDSQCTPFLHYVLKESKWIIILIIVISFVCRFVIYATIIQSASMENTLMTGDFVIFNRLSIVNKSIEHGDIVAFWSDEFDCVLAKRVIGVAGDTVSFKDGYVCVNGQLLEEPYLDEQGITACSHDFVVPEHSIFLLGDNRLESYDSRLWINPYIDEDRIMGLFLVDINSIIRNND